MTSGEAKTMVQPLSLLYLVTTLLFIFILFSVFYFYFFVLFYSVVSHASVLWEHSCTRSTFSINTEYNFPMHQCYGNTLTHVPHFL